MGNEDITILTGLKTANKQGNHRLYYYQGNFFQPMSLASKDKKRTERAVRMFKIKHRDMIATDRADPNYKTLLQFFDGH